MIIAWNFVERNTQLYFESVFHWILRKLYNLFNSCDLWRQRTNLKRVGYGKKVNPLITFALILEMHVLTLIWKETIRHLNFLICFAQPRIMHESDLTTVKVVKLWLPAVSVLSSRTAMKTAEYQDVNIDKACAAVRLNRYAIDSQNQHSRRENFRISGI